MAEGIFDPLAFVQDMPKIVDATMSGALAVAGDTIDAAGKAVGGAVDAAGEIVSNVVEGAGDAYESAKETAAELVRDMAISPLGVAGQIGGSIGTGAASVIEGAAAEWEEADGLGKANIVADTILDVGGFIPVFGIAFDGVHALKQAAQGDLAGAALYGVCAVPLVGDAVAVGKVGYKGLKAASKGAEIAAKGEKVVAEGTDVAVKGSELAGKGAEVTAKGAENVGKGTVLDTAKSSFRELHDAVRAEQAGWNKVARFFTTAPHEAMAVKIFGDLHTAKGAVKTLGTAGGLYGATEVAFGTVAKAFANEGDSAEGGYSEESMHSYIEQYKQTYKEATGEEPTEIKMPDGSTYDTTTGTMYAEDGSVVDYSQSDEQTKIGKESSETDVSSATNISSTGDEVGGTNKLGVGDIVNDIAKQFGLDTTQPPVSSIASALNEFGQWLSQTMKQVASSLGLGEFFGGSASNDLETSLNSQYADDSSYNSTVVANAEVDEVTQTSQEQRVHADTSTLDTTNIASYDQQYY